MFVYYIPIFVCLDARIVNIEYIYIYISGRLICHNNLRMVDHLHIWWVAFLYKYQAFNLYVGARSFIRFLGNHTYGGLDLHQKSMREIYNICTSSFCELSRIAWIVCCCTWRFQTKLIGIAGVTRLWQLLRMCGFRVHLIYERDTESTSIHMSLWQPNTIQVRTCFNYIYTIAHIVRFCGTWCRPSRVNYTWRFRGFAPRDGGTKPHCVPDHNYIYIYTITIILLLRCCGLASSAQMTLVTRNKQQKKPNISPEEVA